MTIKETLKLEARYRASQIKHNRAFADQFCKTYFPSPKDKELMEAMSKGPDIAEKWINENY